MLKCKMKNAMIWILMLILCIPISFALVCEQQTANVSTGCGGLNSGKYAYTNTGDAWNNINNLFDGNDSTYANCVYGEGGGCYYYVNYTIPNGTLGVIFEFKTEDGTQNFTIPAGCLNETSLKINMWSFEETYTTFFCDTTELSYEGFSEMILLYEERVFWNLTDPIIETPFVSPYTLSSPVNGYKYATTNLSLLIYATSNFSNCTYKLSDYVAENCVFNTSQNFSALFGWNEIKICGSNATLNYCETFNFWADKQNKTVSDYFPFIIMLILSLFLIIHGFTSLGISGILGGVLMIITAIMSLTFFNWILCACLVIIALIGMFGAFTK